MCCNVSVECYIFDQCLGNREWLKCVSCIIINRLIKGYQSQCQVLFLTGIFDINLMACSYAKWISAMFCKVVEDVIHVEKLLRFYFLASCKGKVRSLQITYRKRYNREFAEMASKFYIDIET